MISRGSLSWNISIFKFETIRFKPSTTCRHWPSMMQMPSKTPPEWSLIIGKSWPGSSRIFVPKVWFWLLGIRKKLLQTAAPKIWRIPTFFTQRSRAPIFLWNESSFSFTNTKITFRKLSNVGSSPTQNHCCWDYAVPLDTYLDNTVGDGKTQQSSRKAKPYQGTRFRTTPKRQQLRPQPMETTGYSLHNDRLLGDLIHPNSEDQT